MPRPTKRRLDHRGRPLPAGVYLQHRPGGEPTRYKIRWREATAPAQERHYARSFSAKRCGSLDEALRRARAHRKRALEIAARVQAPLEVDPEPGEDPAAQMTLTERFAEWRHLRKTGRHQGPPKADGPLLARDRRAAARQSET